jgi:hypothetical protein
MPTWAFLFPTTTAQGRADGVTPEMLAAHAEQVSLATDHSPPDATYRVLPLDAWRSSGDRAAALVDDE